VALSAGVAQAVPGFFLLPDVSCPHYCMSAVCRSAATASPPVRAADHRAQLVKAAQEEGLKSGGALVLALTAVLHLGSRTEAASEKGLKGLDF
jgi:hypothetical protein